MKIAFLCGSLEKGKDGVGDYTRRLAGELSRQRHQVLLIALNDRHLSSPIHRKESVEAEDIRLLRCPSWNSRSQWIPPVKRVLDEFDPEWLSLQYVPYAFHKKGLPWQLSKDLKKLGQGRKWHIMFHELWIGIDRESSFKNKVIGSFQKQLILGMIAELKPALIHTQSSVYKHELKQSRIEVELLPLFSNIPVKAITERRKKSGNISFVVFGMIQPHAPVVQFIDDLLRFREERGQEINFTFVGRSGTELDTWTSLCREKKLKIKVLGEQSPETISELLSQADWGISSTPFHQSEKSGTIAAMLEHQLPVYCVARSWTPRPQPEAAFKRSIRNYQPNKLDLEPDLDPAAVRYSLQTVTREFFRSLSRYTSK